MRKITVLLFIFILGGNGAIAAKDIIKNVGFTPGHIWISEKTPIVGRTIRIYSVLFNGSEYDMSGKIDFLDNGKLIDSVSVSMSKGTRVQDIWVDWNPREGNHMLSAQITDALVSEPGSVPTRIFPEYSHAQEFSVWVDSDTDKDGSGNAQDTDDDNDGVLDIQENKNGTNPLSADTNGDGVLDGENIKENTLPSVSPFIKSTTGFIAGISKDIIKKLEKLSQWGETRMKKRRADVLQDIKTGASPENKFYGSHTTPVVKKSIIADATSSFEGSIVPQRSYQRKAVIVGQYAYAFLLSFLVLVLKIKILFYAALLIFGSYIFHKIFQVMNS